MMRFQADTSTLAGMRKQELAYSCSDYLYQDGIPSDRMALPQTAINVSCRSSMLTWMNTVVNYIGFDPETVEISMSYLDRFLQTENGQEAVHCRTVYQMAAMTALYIAVKINCAEALTPQLLSELSQGSYQDHQFEEMERIMLHAIQWRVNPPTATAFARETLEILPQSLFATEEIRESVFELSKCQTEWAVGDYDLLKTKKSVIAFAAIGNSLKNHNIRFNLHKFLQDNVKNADMDSRQAILLQKTLRTAIPEEAENECLHNIAVGEYEDDQSFTSCDESVPEPPKRTLSSGKSPRSVASYRNAAA